MNNTASQVKICGLQHLDLLKEVCKLPVDFIGFMLAESRRRVELDSLKAMISYIRSIGPSAPLATGVFVNPDAEELEQILSEAPLDVIQLHGQESPEFCRFIKKKFNLPIIKVFSIKQMEDKESLLDAVMSYRECMDILLLDTHDPVYGGGSGRTFNWGIIPEVKRWAQNEQIPLMIAGGLHPGNVEQLIKRYGPDGVDVSSGVETDGQKDLDKIITFVERVKQL